MYFFLSKYVHFDKYLLCLEQGRRLIYAKQSRGYLYSEGYFYQGGYVYLFLIHCPGGTSIKEGMFIWHYRVVRLCYFQYLHFYSHLHLYLGLQSMKDADGCMINFPQTPYLFQFHSFLSKRLFNEFITALEMFIPMIH